MGVVELEDSVQVAEASKQAVTAAGRPEQMIRRTLLESDEFLQGLTLKRVELNRRARCRLSSCVDDTNALATFELPLVINDNILNFSTTLCISNLKEINMIVVNRNKADCSRKRTSLQERPSREYGRTRRRRRFAS